ncbi:diphthamide synthesis protein, putative [Plasmodium gallinaceum]|uniref:Diphthamide synthesis protein, putative n=1 Tax=Plasmodium gallinaceum TaxID=5849 RepID=A0A1J1GTM1_PLAGA|nr:diphthamide synthesis protein, putative [Plasmodium gallinaceum]CRG95799.1 diphthamide synthesis protein, putative [Plasmodium gallinaceum]
MKINPNEIIEKYEIELITKIILNYNFKSIAIQLPDSMLNDSIYISNIIQNKLKDKNIIINSNIDDKEKCMNSVCEKNQITLKDENNSKNIINLYVLGDTTLNECCEDYVSADHVHADFLIHYGISCQSFIIPYIPSIYIFNKKKLEQDFYLNINKYLVENKIFEQKKISTILCDVSYSNSMNSIVSSFIDKRSFNYSFLFNNKIIFDINNDIFTNNSFYEYITGEKEEKDEVHLRKNNNSDENDNLIFTNIIICIHRIANNINKKVYYGFFDNYITFDIEEKINEKYFFLCGRILFKIFINVKEKHFIYKIVSKDEKLSPEDMNIFIFPSENNNFLNRSLLEYGSNYDIFIYNEKSIFKKENIIDKILLKRYSLIEKCKNSNVFGIIIGNVNLDKNRDLRKLINYILRKNGKKCFIIVTNKINSAKLENFHDIEMYILLTCPENNLLELKDFSKKIINSYEFFVAYDYMDWNCKYLFEFYDLLSVTSIKKEFESMNKNKYIFWDYNNELMSLQDKKKDEIDEKSSEENLILEKYDHLIDYNSSIPVEDQKKFITKFHDKSQMCEYFINSLKENEKREFKGVDMNYNIDNIPRIVQGLKGIAQRYNSDMKFFNKNE